MLSRTGSREMHTFRKLPTRPVKATRSGQPTTPGSASTTAPVTAPPPRPAWQRSRFARFGPGFDATGRSRVPCATVSVPDESAQDARRPLLPFVEKLNQRLPKKWDRKLNRLVQDDDWLLWDFHTTKIRGKHVESIRK